MDSKVLVSDETQLHLQEFTDRRVEELLEETKQQWTPVTWWKEGRFFCVRIAQSDVIAYPQQNTATNHQ